MIETTVFGVITVLLVLGLFYFIIVKVKHLPGSGWSPPDIHKQGPEALATDTMKQWYRSRAVSWWSRNSTTFALCDDCNARLERNEGYLRTSKIACEACTDQLLKSTDWPAAFRDPLAYFGRELPTSLSEKLRTWAVSSRPAINHLDTKSPDLEDGSPGRSSSGAGQITLTRQVVEDKISERFPPPQKDPVDVRSTVKYWYISVPLNLLPGKMLPPPYDGILRIPALLKVETLQDLASGRETKNTNVLPLFTSEEKAIDGSKAFAPKGFSIEADRIGNLDKYEFSLMKQGEDFVCMVDPDIFRQMLHVAGLGKTLSGYVYSTDELACTTWSVTVLGHRATLNREGDDCWDVAIEDGYKGVWRTHCTAAEALRAAEEHVREVDEARNMSQVASESQKHDS